jgi:hypothetical protein
MGLLVLLNYKKLPYTTGLVGLFLNYNVHRASVVDV